MEARLKCVDPVELSDHWPLRPAGYFAPYATWTSWLMEGLTTSAFRSAMAADVFLVERRGPRGGIWLAVKSDEAWQGWVKVYKGRVEKLRASKAARMLGAPPPRR